MEITGLSGLNLYLQQHAAVLLYFYNDNCAPCVALRPKVNALLEQEFPLMKVVYMNAQQQPELAGAFGIFSSPTLLVLFEGKEVARESKYVSVESLREKISRYYTLLFE
jgi:thioredoxin-like negative regulator of GroEL